jgi:hypothetical protein
MLARFINWLYAKYKDRSDPPHVHDANCCCRELEYERACREAPVDESIPDGKITFMGTPFANEHGNAYGSIWAQYENGKRMSVLCGHGGSMWCCLDCAQAFVSGKPAPRQETNRFSSPSFRSLISQIDGETSTKLPPCGPAKVDVGEVDVSVAVPIPDSKGAQNPSGLIL